MKKMNLFGLLLVLMAVSCAEPAPEAPDDIEELMGFFMSTMKMKMTGHCLTASPSWMNGLKMKTIALLLSKPLHSQNFLKPRWMTSTNANAKPTN